MPSLVSSAKDSWSWLKDKGWVLNSKDNSAPKLTDILLSATISFKLPANASTATHAVAFLLCAHTDENLAATVTNHIINKVIDKISNPLAKLNQSINSNRFFLDAALQKQAAELLSLQDAVKQQVELIKFLTDVQPLNPRGLSDATQLLLAATGLQSSIQALLGPVPPHINTPADPKVAQQVGLTSKQLLIDYGLLEEGEELWTSTINEKGRFGSFSMTGLTPLTHPKLEKGSPHHLPHAQFAMSQFLSTPHCS